jgi:hypothetical protein
MIQSQPQQRSLKSLPMLAVASALLVVGFAVGQITPSLAGALGTALDSPQTEAVAPVVAPALTTVDDYGTRLDAFTPALTTGDDYATRLGAAAPALTTGDDFGTRHGTATGR